jgi:hypothetical protein
MPLTPLATAPAPPGSLLAAAGDGRDPVALLATHRSYLERFEDVAETLAAEGRVDEAIAAVTLAGTVATVNASGVLASPRLEAVLAGIAAEHLAPLAPRAARPERQTILHLTTETFGTGGHTRVMWRWISRDPHRRHILVTTAQRAPMPEGLVRAVKASGGDVFALPADAPPLARAAAVRELAAEADVVVMLPMGHDPVPTLAFSHAGARPPVVVYDHGDQLFALGRSVIDVLQAARPIGSAIAVGRRGFPEARSVTLPFPVAGADGHGRSASEPISARERALARAEILGRLGWPADTVLLITVGRDFKYIGPAGTTLLELVEPLLGADSPARLVAVGPADEGAWNAARARTGGRVAAVGSLTDGVGALLAAADVYLESAPCGGPASAGEAASHGLPVLSHAATPLEGELWLTHPMYGATCTHGSAEYREMLARLIAEPALREEMGARARTTAAAADAAWEPKLEEVYALARRLGPVSVDEFGPLPTEPAAIDALVELQHADAKVDIPRERIDRALAALELTTRNPALRAGPYPSAFAAPGADPAVLAALVAEFRRLSLAGLAARFVIALHEGDVAAAVPVLEEAIAAGPDVDVDLIVADAPLAQRPAGALEVVAGGEPGPHRHVLKVAAAAPTLP